MWEGARTIPSGKIASYAAVLFWTEAQVVQEWGKKRIMAHKESFGRQLAIVLASCLALNFGVALAQPPASRLAGDWRSSAPVALTTAKPPASTASADLGATPSDAKLERMLLLLAPSAAQQQALSDQLAGQQNPASAQFHHWLTASAFADAYANSAADVAAVSAWLAGQGFQVAALPASRGWIEFSGTAAQVEQAFHTQLHSAATPQGTRAFLAAGVSVPAALRPLIHGLVSLDGALAAPAITASQPVAASAAELAAQTSAGRAEALTPQLAAQLLHLDALHSAGQTGTGQTIAIPARGSVRGADIAAFRSAFGLPPSPLAVHLNGPDPGATADQAEATLAASWAGAAAPGARILVVPAATTAATDGLDLALAAIVDQALAHTVTVGYSSCEAALSEAHQAFYAALYRQAAAEGIAVVAATGDSGPAACHAAGSDARVSSGYGVNALASTPWNTAVGVAALGSGGALAAWSPVNEADPAYAGGGGRSALYLAPNWQPVPPQFQQDSSQQRLLPDLALPAAIDSEANRGLAFCMSSSASSKGCTLVRAGGSSGSAALFAGIAALLAQKHGAQGNLAPGLYALGSQSSAFGDVRQGNARLGCAAGSPGCGASGQIGFAAAPGYDLATGLGTVNAEALLTQWGVTPNAGSGSAKATLTVSPIEPNATYNPSAVVTFASQVISQTGGAIPTGSVTFMNASTNSALSAPSTLNAGGNASLVVNLASIFTNTGSFDIQARYNGDLTYNVATSAPLVITTEKSFTVLTVKPSTTSPAAGADFSVTVPVTVATQSGPPVGSSLASGLVTLNVDGQPTYYASLSTINGVPTATFSNVSIASSSSPQHALQATYAGDGNYAAATSPAVTITLAKGGTTSSVTPSTNSPYAFGALELTASVTASSSGTSQPSGSFTFTIDGQSVGNATLQPGSPSTATVAITAPAAGNHTVAGSYSGDTNFTASTASGFVINAIKDTTTLALTPSTTTPAPGTPMQLTATLTPLNLGTTVPTGTVAFTLDGGAAGTAPLVAGTTASLTVTSPSAGSHNLQASYNGDTNYLASTSPSVNINVAKINTTLVVTPATLTPTAGSSLQVSATITAASPGSTQPSGTVIFTVDGTSVGTATVAPGSPSTASVTITTLTPGSHTLQATYSGDTYYNTSSAATVNLTVAKSPTTTVVIPATVTPTAGGSLQVTANITAASPGTTLPTGTVNFMLDNVSQGVQSVTTGSPATATMTIPILTAGTHTLVATYSGDNYYATSISSTVTLSVAKGATLTTVTATPPTLTLGSTETLTATITPIDVVTGTIYTITGTVSFYDGGSTLLGKAVVSSNVATLTGVALSGSVNHTITAVYSGDTNWLASLSAPITLLSLTQPDTVVLTSNITNAQPGQVVVLTATVTPDSTPSPTGEQNPTGNVVFYLGTTVLGESALAPVPLSYSSTATLTLATLPGGQDTVYAVYLGDLYYDKESSNLLTLNIQDFTITPSPTNPPTNLTIIKGSSGAASFIVTGLGGFNNEVQVVCAVPSQDDMTCTATPQQLIPTGTVTFIVQTFLTGTTTSARNAPPSIWPRAAGGTALALLSGFFLLPWGKRARIFSGRSSRRFMVLLLLLVGLAGVGIGCNNVNLIASPGTPLGVATLKITGSAYVDNTVVSHSIYLTVNVIPKP